MANEKNKKNITPEDFADRRKAIETLYSGDLGIKTYVRQSTGSAASSYSEATLTRILNSVGVSTITTGPSGLNELLKLTNYAYATDTNYSNIVNYFANMFLWRYYYVPVMVKDKASGANYEETYKLISEVIDGMSLEVVIPVILTSLFKDGAVYLYTEKNTSAKTISTFLLDPRYCTPVMMSQYGTGIYQFNAKYFDDLNLSLEKKEEILLLYPEELVAGYNAYKSDSKLQYFIIDGRFGSYIQLNDYGFPTQLGNLKSIFDYQKYRTNEVERSSAQLDKIISHKIPTYEKELLFELDEIKALHKSMSNQLGTNTRVRLLTTFGDVEVHPLGDADKVQNEVLEKAFQSIYSSAGLNSSLFTGDSDGSIETSLNRDGAYVWKFIQQLMNFYNISINNLYNFKGYQAELVMLPMTWYNSSELLGTYKSNAEYGVGRLELIVASGTKQRHITPKAELEKFLKLEEVLQPLQSSHTQTGSEPIKKESSSEEKTKKEPVEKEE
jgi:hypothetical protein